MNALSLFILLILLKAVVLKLGLRAIEALQEGDTHSTSKVNLINVKQQCSPVSKPIKIDSDKKTITRRPNFRQGRKE